MRELLLGIDIGTSACKVAVFDKQGNVIGSEVGNYQVYYPNPGWVEQDPDEWWEAVCGAIKKMLYNAQIKPEEIKGIGIDGQSWSAIPIDHTGKVLANTPIWMDTRAMEICDRLNQSVGEENIFELAGNSLQPSYTTAKIIWFKEYMPEMYANIYKILQSNSFIAYRLTGVCSQDVSQGYGLHCFDMRKKQWDKEMCEKLGIPFSFLSPIYECHEVIGQVNKKAAELSGLCEGTPVVAGALDAACGTLGAGVIHPGETQEQGGQAGGMSICTEEYVADPRLILGYHAVPGKWLLQGGTVGGGGVMRWMEREFGSFERSQENALERSSLMQFNDLADPIAPGSDGLVFLPYMAGERSPIWDPNAKGVFYGLDFSKTKGHFIRAAMEGVAFALQHNLRIAEEQGAKVQELMAVGGAANSLLWTQIKADITGKTILVPSSDTATTLGAVILAGVGIGMYESFEEAISLTVKKTRTHTPNMENHEQYKKSYETYLKLYQSLEPIMNQEEA